HGTRGTVERGQEAVAGGVDLAPAEALELPAHRAIVRREEHGPAAVAELRGARRRADDVGEEHRGEHTIGLRRAADSRQELLDLVDDLVGIDPGDVHVPWKLDEPRARGSARRCSAPPRAARRGRPYGAA